MRLSRVVARGFRNLDCEVPLPAHLTLIAGENNAGKSNLIDAVRLLITPRTGAGFRFWITADDFAHDGSGLRLTDTFELEAVFSDLSDAERARMVTCLSPSLGERTARLRMSAQLTAAGRVRLAWYGGDGLQPNVEEWAKEAATHTYLQPLRDAAADLRPGRDNKLVHLLKALAPEGGAARVEIETVAGEANTKLDQTSAVGQAREEIQKRLRAMAGARFAQKSGLAFSDPRFERVVGALRALAGDEHELPLSENGLGFNNLLYMATLLAAIDNEPDEGLHVLLVEEPEAHLHPQLQDLLMRFLEQQAKDRTQVIVTTHSPNFASASGVERMTVMVREPATRAVLARAPADFGLEKTSLEHLRRFLDVTKASLLFARGVVLVEGIAEQLLLPAVARRLGTPLHTAGVAVVNVGGLSFAPFIDLFASDRLPVRCAVISDGDPPLSAETQEELEQGERSLSATAVKLKERESETVHVFLSEQTLEWDLAEAGNWDVLLGALKLVKPRVAARLGAEHADSSPQERALALRTAVEDVKGRFAQALVHELENGAEFAVPSYLRDAVAWAMEAPEPARELEPEPPPEE